jgi:hypothetical protein
MDHESVPYPAQEKVRWYTQQQKNFGYFITSFATGTNGHGPSELRAAVQNAVEKQGATLASVLLAACEEHLYSEHTKKDIAKVHGKAWKGDDSAGHPNLL